MGSLSAGYDRFMYWKTADGKKEASNLVSQLETLIKGLLNKRTLIDYIRFFILFEKKQKKKMKMGKQSYKQQRK